MTEDVKPEVIKKTQDVLGKYFKKPPLTEKLLKKPPFRFLHDIVTAVIRETKFLEGLFSEEELNSDNIKDKEAKLAFLTKLVDVVKLISGANLTVRPSKIISGQEATKTNELLQAIGKALDKKVSSAEAIEHYKKSLEKKGKSSSKDKSAVKEAKKTSTRQTSEARKSEEIDKPSVETRKRSSSASKASINEKNEDKKRKDKLEKDSNKETRQSNETINIPPAEPAPERILSSSQRRKQSGKSKQNHIPPVSSGDLSKLNFLQNFEKKRDEYVRRKDSATKAQQPLEGQSAQLQNDVVNTTEQPSVDSIDSEAVILNSNEEGEKKAERLDGTDSKENGTREKEVSRVVEKSASEIAVQKTQSDNMEARPKTSLRPPSARPISARPAAPRMRAKTELIVNEEIPTPMGNISVIVENSDIKEDDDAEDMVVMEAKGGGGDSLENIASYKLDNQLSQEHGHLVAQILETQRELVNNENVDVVLKKTDIAWEAGSQRNREVVAKEIDKLRSTIQVLTRATNPLGKLLDYVQEDVEMMQKELLDWRVQYQQINEQLEMEKIKTKELIEPMKETLQEIDNQIKLQLDKICQAKSQIIKNDQKIQTLLNGHSQV